MTGRAAGDGGAGSSSGAGGGAAGERGAGGSSGAGDASAGRAAADLGRASIMIDLHRYSEAARLLSTILAGQPDNSRAWCQLSRTHLGTGNCAAAVQAADRARALDPADDWPYRLASTALLGLDQTRDAVAAALEARSVAPLSWRSHVCLAQAATADGQLELAGEASAAALAIAPEEADVHVTAGRVALSRGELTLAQQRQEAALAIEPGHNGALNELGRISLSSRDAAGAARHFLRAARSAPGNPVFGGNTELALRQVAIRVIATLAAVLAAALSLVLVALAGQPMLAAGLALTLPVLTGWAITKVWRLPPEGRRHLVRLIRASPVLSNSSTLSGERSRDPARVTRVSRLQHRPGDPPQTGAQ